MSASDKVPLEFAAKIAGDTEVASRVRGMGGALGNFGNQADTAGQKTERFTESGIKLTTRLKDSALGISTAATAATSLWFQYGNLEKASQRVEKAEVSRLSAESSLAGAQATLNAMVEKGVTSGDRYEAAVLRLESSQARLKTSTVDVELAQGDLQESQTRFALSVVPTVLGSVSALTTGLKGVSFSAISARFSSLSLAGSQLVLAPALGGTTRAATATTFSLKGLALGFKTALLAMGPPGFILLGIGAALTIVATNTFGVRDALEDFAETVKKTIPILAPLIDAFGFIGDALFGAADATEEFTDSTDDAQPSVAAVNKELSLSEKFLASQKSALAASTQANFDLIASTYDLGTAEALTTDQLAGFGDALRETNILQQEAADAADKEAEAHEAATDKIRSRIEANLALAESMGLNIDASKTTVGETDRIRDHLERLNREYTSSRRSLEEFAIAQGVDIVDAVQASDDALLDHIFSLGTLDEKTGNTQRRLVEDFNKSKNAVKDFQLSASEDLSLFADNFTMSADSIISDNARLQASLRTTINEYRNITPFAVVTRSVTPPTTSVNPFVRFGGPFGGQGGIAARIAQRGMDEVLTQDTTILAHAGEHARITPAGRGNGQRIVIENHLHLDGREIAHSVSKRLAGEIT